MRASKGEIGLVRMRSGVWAIRWGRRLSRERGVAVIESTGRRSLTEAKAQLRRRQGEVLTVDAPIEAQPLPLPKLVSAFLEAYAAGSLPGKAPGAAAIELAIHLALGEKRGLVAFAKSTGGEGRFDEVVARRWIEARAVDDAKATVRHLVNVVRRIATYGRTIGAVTDATLTAVRTIRPPPAGKGRVHLEGVPTDEEVALILRALEPRRRDGAPYHLVAELQLRLGLRPSEVVALQPEWLDEEARCVHVIPGGDFRPKDFDARTIDGVDAATFELARRVLELRGCCSRTGYKQAWRRAVDRLSRANHRWRYRAKGQSLRAVHATVSRTRGIPLSVVARRLGHASERTTEAAYVGLQRNQHRGAYEGVPLHSLKIAAKKEPE